MNHFGLSILPICCFDHTGFSSCIWFSSICVPEAEARAWFVPEEIDSLKQMQDKKASIRVAVYAKRQAMDHANFST